MTNPLKLGVNIDHVATLRQARYALMPDAHNVEPSLLRAAKEALEGGADSITIHLREDRRHIQDKDLETLGRETEAPLNLELGNTEEILKIACEAKPAFACLVPENRAEITTEGGLDVIGHREALTASTKRLQTEGIRVSFFIDPELSHIEAAAECGADMVELHTGTFANAAPGAERDAEVQRLTKGATAAHDAGLQVNAGHGITSANLADLFKVPHLAELNVGHHLISEAVSSGLKSAVATFKRAMAAYPARLTS
ncbi:MAG: pyridoxine 5'-phosphate synthase [Verrucomicrobiota bacterium]